MDSKLVKTEQGVMILLPEDALNALGLTPDSEVSIIVRPEQGQIIISSVSHLQSDIDETFAQQLAEFIDRYRPALDALAK